MPLRFEAPTEISDELLEGLVDVWTAAVNAGGAVGFVAPVDRDVVAERAPITLEGVAKGLDKLVVGFVDSGEVAAWCLVTDKRFKLQDHVRMVKCVMVDPRLQGSGYGVELMLETERVARTLDGVRLLHLVLRGGMGLERFYEKCGYVETGRLPGALRVGADDFRDEVSMSLVL